MVKQNQRITITDIAKEAGVSETTISRYLNGKFEYMSENTRKKIDGVVARLDYRPSSIARSLKSKKSFLIGAVIADIENPFSTFIIKGLSDCAGDLGYSVLIAVSDDSVEKENKQIQRFIDNGVDGLIVNTVGGNDEALLEIKKSGIPIVLIDRDVKASNLDLVTTDNLSVGKGAMAHLVDNGFKGIGFFTGSLDESSTRRERHQAFLEVAKMYPDLDCRTFFVERNNEEDMDAKLSKFLEMPKPRVIFAVNGVVLLAVLEAIKRGNYRINEDFGILGFDDWRWTKIIDPGITAVSQQSYLLGEEACKLVVQRINGDNSPEPIHKLFPAELMIRASTNPQ